MIYKEIILIIEPTLNQQMAVLNQQTHRNQMSIQGGTHGK
jgi:hypothetical protein